MVGGRLSRQWPELQVSLVTGPSQRLRIVPGAPVGRLEALLAVGACAVVGYVVGLGSQQPVRMASLGLVIGCGLAVMFRQVWRLRKPVLDLDGQRELVHIPHCRLQMAVSAIGTVLGVVHFEARGFREYRLALLRDQEGERSEVEILRRNNFDNDPTKFRDDSTSRSLRDLAEELAHALGARAEMRESRQEMGEGSPVAPPERRV